MVIATTPHIATISFNTIAASDWSLRHYANITMLTIGSCYAITAFEGRRYCYHYAIDITPLRRAPLLRQPLHCQYWILRSPLLPHYCWSLIVIVNTVMAITEYYCFITGYDSWLLILVTTMDATHYHWYAAITPLLDANIGCHYYHWYYY